MTAWGCVPRRGPACRRFLPVRVLPEPETRGLVRLPEIVRSPWWTLTRRVLLATAIMVVTVLLVYVDRGGYRDTSDPSGKVGLVDSV